MSFVFSHVEYCYMHFVSVRNPKDNYDISGSVYVDELNGFMSLRC